MIGGYEHWQMMLLLVVLLCPHCIISSTRSLIHSLSIHGCEAHNYGVASVEELDPHIRQWQHHAIYQVT
jgi:hypothetical protein